MFGSQISLGMGDSSKASPARGRRRSPHDVFHSALGSDFSEQDAPAGAAREVKAEQSASLARHVAKDAADSVLKTVRAKLRFLGCRGIAGISKKFRIIDDDNSGSLSPVEFHKAMAEVRGGVVCQKVRKFGTRPSLETRGGRRPSAHAEEAAPRRAPRHR